MKKNTIKKSSITLPPDELAIVEHLLKKLNAKSKVDVIRRALYLLKEVTETKLVQEQFAAASLMVREANAPDMKELDLLSGEGIPDEY